MFRTSNPPTQNGYYSYFLIDDSAASKLRRFLSQILETTLEEGSTPMILTLTKTEFDSLATAYHDLLVGYRHPRQDSMAFRFREQDETVQKLKKLYPQWLTCEDLPPQTLVNYKSLSKKGTAIPLRKKT